MNLTKEEIELLINLLQNDELSFTNDFQTLIDKLTITKEYYEDSISGIIKCGYEMKSEELMEVFDLMVKAYVPFLIWVFFHLGYGIVVLDFIRCRAHIRIACTAIARGCYIIV